MGDLDVGNLLGLVIVGGVAMKVADNLTKPRHNRDNDEDEEKRPTKKGKVQKKAEENGYTRNRYMFGNNKNSPF